MSPLRSIKRFAVWCSAMSATPTASVLAFLSIIAWAAFGPVFHFSEGWQLVANTGTTLVNFQLSFLLLLAGAIAYKAIHAKLDAIILALKNADNRLIRLEDREEEEIDALRSEVADDRGQA